MPSTRLSRIVINHDNPQKNFQFWVQALDWMAHIVNNACIVLVSLDPQMESLGQNKFYTCGMHMMMSNTCSGGLIPIRGRVALSFKTYSRKIQYNGFAMFSLGHRL